MPHSFIIRRLFPGSWHVGTFSQAHRHIWDLRKLLREESEILPEEGSAVNQKGEVSKDMEKTPSAS